jgi:uncharacterized protein (TIGR02444 family)
MPDDDNPFWQFSLSLYGRPGIAEACLRLQDRDGLDVNVVLYCCWAASRGAALDGAAIAFLAACSAEWQARVTGPLRAVRRNLKTGVRPVALPDSAPLREAVKALELESERLFQNTLWRNVALPPETPSDNPASLALASLGRYAGLTGRAVSDEMRRVAAGISAASAA